MNRKDDEVAEDSVPDTLSPSFSAMRLGRKRSNHPCASPDRSMRGTNLNNAFIGSNGGNGNVSHDNGFNQPQLLKSGRYGKQGGDMNHSITMTNHNNSAIMGAFSHQSANYVLTQNAIVTMNGMASFMDNPSFKPTVQVLDVSNTSRGGQQRWEVVISDGIYCLDCTMVPRLSQLILGGSISINCFVVIKEFNMDTSQSTKGALLFDVAPLGYNPHTCVGNPVRIMTLTNQSTNIIANRHHPNHMQQTDEWCTPINQNIRQFAHGVNFCSDNSVNNQQLQLRAWNSDHSRSGNETGKAKSSLLNCSVSNSGLSSRVHANIHTASVATHTLRSNDVEDTALAAAADPDADDVAKIVHNLAISEEDIIYSKETTVTLPATFPALETKALGEVPSLSLHQTEIISGVMSYRSLSMYNGFDITDEGTFIKFKQTNAPIVVMVQAKEIRGILDCAYDSDGYVVSAALKKVQRGKRSQLVKHHFDSEVPSHFFITNTGAWVSTTNITANPKLGAQEKKLRHIIYGTGRDDEDDTETVPYFCGYYEQTINLPFDGSIPNPVYSIAAAQYLCDTWMKQPAFWSMSVMNFLRVGLGMHIAASNQHSEANFKHIKGQPDIRIHCSEPATYLHHAWDEQEQGLKCFIKEYESAKHIMDRRMQKSKTKSEAKTEDAAENEVYNKTGAKWGTGKKTYKEEMMVRGQLATIFDQLYRLKMIEGYNTNTMHNFLSKYHAKKNIGDLNKMGMSSWRTFIGGKRDPDKRVQGSNMALFESFIDDYNKQLGIEVLNG